MKKGRSICYVLAVALTVALLGMIWRGTAFAEDVPVSSTVAEEISSTIDDTVEDSSDFTTTEANTLESFALAFLDEYLWDVYMYDMGDYTPYMTLPSGESTAGTSALSTDELATLQAAQSNMRYIEDKAAYWRAGRQAYGGTRRDFSISYGVMDSLIQESHATLKISAIVTFYYGDTDSISLGQHIFELSFAKIGESWIIADVLEINDWFDSYYKNNPEFDAEYLITEMVDAITEGLREDQYVEQAQLSAVESVGESQLDSTRVVAMIPYNGANAAAYALTYTHEIGTGTEDTSTYNQNFQIFSSDCMNFASQCIWAGLGGSNDLTSINGAQNPMDTTGSYW